MKVFENMDGRILIAVAFETEPDVHYLVDNFLKEGKVRIRRQKDKSAQVIDIGSFDTPDNLTPEALKAA